eukprot:TRINITY_DN19445_c0_g1_i1.p1 TRINITY_DN19445_c0_g1~~TRINITY_DN19445_c0_g1_i1.p1  ORF type:complete len:328 (+),score=53.05 TRINITY_DN19445_c0_g1_i1:93-1076(+)
MLAMKKAVRDDELAVEGSKRKYLSTRERMMAASVGSVLVALTMTPLDVVKVKVQAGMTGSSTLDCVRNPYCREFYVSNGMMELKQLKSKWPCFKEPSPCIHSPTLTLLRSTLRYEGVRGLYAGFVPTIMMSAPNNVMYFAAYETGKDAGVPPVVAGSTARVLSTSLVAPLEFIRTRIQAGNNIASVRSTIRAEGYTVLWRGIVPTLWRDVPFSGLYWGSYETVMGILNVQFPSTYSFYKAFIAGGLSGSISALFTMPFDVVKTRHQVQNQTVPEPTQRVSLWTSIVTISRTEGISSLFAGLGPRIARAGPSCAIMISAYEAMKLYLL